MSGSSLSQKREVGLDGYTDAEYAAKRAHEQAYATEPKKSGMTVKELAWHRNGVCGEGFYVALIEGADEGGIKVAIRFQGEGRCAVLDIEETAKENIAFAMGNSWRGDHYIDIMDAAIRAHYAEKAWGWCDFLDGEEPAS